MFTIALVSSLLLGAPGVTAQTADGEKVAGELSQLTPQGVVLKTPQGERTVPLDKLMNVTFERTSSAPAASANAAVRLTDGSLLAAASFLVKKGVAEVTLAGGQMVKISTRAIGSVRFTDPALRDDKLAQQWSTIVDTKAAADLIVVRKQGTIDFLEGVIQDIDSETVKFELDNEVIPVKRPKVEGLVYYQAAAEEAAEGIGQAVSLYGSRVSAKSLSIDGDKLHIVSPAGVEIDWPLDALQSIDFSGGKIVYLSDLEPLSSRYVSYFGLPKAVAGLSDFFQPVKDLGLEQNPLKLDGKTYRKGLSLRSRTQLEYRLPAKFRRFQAVVGIDDSVRESGHAKLVIQGDGKMLWEGIVRGVEPARPLDLDVTGVKRLEILVDFGDDLDIGDHVDLCDAKVLK